MTDIIAWKFVIENPDLIDQYRAYVQSSLEAERAEKRKALEGAFATIQGAKFSGKDSDKGLPDFQVVDEDVVSAYQNIYGASDSANIEAKLTRSTRLGATVGASNITGQTSFIESFKQDIKTRLRQRQDETEQEYVERTLSSLFSRKKAEITKLVKSDPTLGSLFYNKAKILQIFKQTDAGSIVAYNFAFSRQAFNSAIFEIEWRKRAGRRPGFQVNLSSAYERQLIAKVVNQAFTVGEDTKSLKAIFTEKLLQFSASKKSKVAQFSKELKNIKITTFINTGGSIPVARATIKRTKQDSVDRRSIIDLTVAVRGRVRLRMRRGDRAPYPPKIFERSGTFRRSIEAFADLRTNTIRYFYEPYYLSLEKYGYKVDDLVTGSIRAIAQNQFNRQFNLVRRKS